jgi:DNA ligase-4
MKLGISEKTVLKSFHPDALDLFNVCSSLRTVCQKLKWGGPTVRI